MSTVTPTTLIEGTLLTPSAVILYTVPGSTTTTVRSLTLCNTDTVRRYATVYLVASAGSASAANTIFDAVGLAPSETLTDDSVRTMMTGDFIAALADADAVISLRVDGAEIT